MDNHSGNRESMMSRCGGSYYTFDREEMAKYVPPGSTKILDVGCSAGNFGKLLKSRMSVEVWGIEKFDEAAHSAMTKIDRVIVGDVESDDLELPLDYFDCIVLNDVLEHFVHPWSVLNKLKRNIVRRGTIVASIPNVRYWGNIRNLVFFKKWEYEEAGILDRSHLRFFTIKSIEKMFVECGYEVIILEGLNKLTMSLKFRLLNLMLNHSLDDMQFRQFACVARNSQ